MIMQGADMKKIFMKCATYWKIICVYVQDGKTEEKMQDRAIVELFLERNECGIKEASEKYNNYCMRISMNILNNIEDSE